MARRLFMTALSVFLLLTAGCTTSLDGRPAAAPPTSTGRTIAPPSADGPTTRGTTTTPTTDAATGTDTAEPEPDGSTTPTAGPDRTSSPDPETGGVPDVLLGPVVIGPGPDGYLLFQTPSGNIFCGMSGDGGEAGVRCDLIQADYPDVVPLDCGDVGDFHAGTASLDGAGSPVIGGCLSDTVIDPSAVPLPYGANAGTGDIVCHSAQDGVTCGNLVTGHGFQVARNAHRTF